MPVVVVGGVDALPGVLDLERTVAHHEPVDQIVQERDLRGEIGRVTGGPLAEADDAFVGIELDEEPLPAAHERRVVVQQDGFYAGDFHSGIPNKKTIYKLVPSIGCPSARGRRPQTMSPGLPWDCPAVWAFSGFR